MARTSKSEREAGLANSDPLLDLLDRYRAERKAFDEAEPSNGVSDVEWDRIALSTWWRTQREIIQSEPAATTLAGALSALDYVLQSDDLFGDRLESADLQMLWLLVKAARDYLEQTQHETATILEL